MLAIVLICVAASAAFVLLFLMEVAPGRNPLVAYVARVFMPFQIPSRSRAGE